MCHTEIAAGQETPAVNRRELNLGLSTGEEMPALEVGEPRDRPVLLIADVFGRNPFYEHLAAVLADAGFHVVLPEFFFRQGPLEDGSRAAAFARRDELDQARSVEDLREAVMWLRQLHPGRVGVVGFCIGGTFALDLASTEVDLVTVAFYGFPVPPANASFPPPAPMDLVTDLRGPVLALWGDEDETVGIDNVRRYVQLATRENDAFQYEIVSGFGHGFLGSADLTDPSDVAGAVWGRAVAYLDEHSAPRRSEQL